MKLDQYMKTNMRCLVFAYSQLGYDCLKYLLENTEYVVVAVVTHENHPGEYIWFDSVKKLALQHDVDVLTPDSLKSGDVQSQINAYKADVLLSFYYRNMIPESIFLRAPLGAYNMHGSLLPKYRGRCPVNWALINGEAKTGVTLHHMVKSADAGDIVDQAETVIAFEDTAGSVMERLNVLAVEVVKRSLPLIANKTASRIVQNVDDATYFSGRSSKDSEIDWSCSAIDIYNLVRALQPNPQYPAAYGEINGLIYHVKHCELLRSSGLVETKPGTLICMHSKETFEISCGNDGSEAILLTVN